jgi:hypothetical protein
MIKHEAAPENKATPTGRFEFSRPEMQDINPHRKRRPAPVLDTDLSEVERRVLAHYSDHLKA